VHRSGRRALCLAVAVLVNVLCGSDIQSTLSLDAVISALTARFMPNPGYIRPTIQSAAGICYAHAVLICVLSSAYSWFQLPFGLGRSSTTALHSQTLIWTAGLHVRNSRPQ
jgi:hypothetical protein